MNHAYLMFKANTKNGRDSPFGIDNATKKDKQQPEIVLVPVAKPMTGSGSNHHDQIGKESSNGSSSAWSLLYPATYAVIGYVVGGCLGEMYYWVKNTVFKYKSVHHMEKQDKDKLPPV